MLTDSFKASEVRQDKSLLGFQFLAWIICSYIYDLAFDCIKIHSSDRVSSPSCVKLSGGPADLPLLFSVSLASESLRIFAIQICAGEYWKHSHLMMTSYGLHEEVISLL